MNPTGMETHLLHIFILKPKPVVRKLRCESVHKTGVHRVTMLQVLGKLGTWRDSLTGVCKTRGHSVIMVQGRDRESWNIGHISLSRSYCIYYVFMHPSVFFKN